MLNNSKGSFKIPQGVSPSKFPVHTEQVTQPAGGNVIGCAVETAELANMDIDTSSFNVPPRPVSTSQRCTIPKLTLPDQSRIFWRGSMNVTSPPACLMMSDRHGMVTASAVGHIQPAEFGYREIAASQPVDYDLAVRVDLPDGCNRVPDQSGM